MVVCPTALWLGAKLILDARPRLDKPLERRTENLGGVGNTSKIYSCLKRSLGLGKSPLLLRKPCRPARSAESRTENIQWEDLRQTAWRSTDKERHQPYRQSNVDTEASIGNKTAKRNHRP